MHDTGIPPRALRFAGCTGPAAGTAGAARDFLAGLGVRFPEITAVLCISAHGNTPRPAVSAVMKPATTHDFSGSPRELFTITCPAPGSPELAHRVAGLIEAAGLPCDSDAGRGLDHGARVPLMLMYPEARVPVVQFSIQSHVDPARHLALGDSPASLRHEGVLVVGSGGAVHPLGDPTVAPGDGLPTDGWAISFSDWLNRAVTAGERESLVRYRSSAPSAVHAQPCPDHFMPLLVAPGAAGPRARGRILHQSWYWGNLGMGACEFPKKKSCERVFTMQTGTCLLAQSFRTAPLCPGFLSRGWRYR